jgi:hypothetical protein
MDILCLIGFVALFVAIGVLNYRSTVATANDLVESIKNANH